MRTPLAELVHASWLPALEPHAQRLAEIGDFLRAETAAGRRWLPAPANILRAFEQPLDDVRVLIVGQDPYPTPGHPIGLSFAVAADVRPLPRSLANIYTELVDDLGVPRPANGDLTPWTKQGVMLLNRVLTVQAGNSGSHRGKGWEQITASAIEALATRGRPAKVGSAGLEAAAHDVSAARADAPLVAILWGRDAQGLVPMLGDVPVITSAHPSPMSADRGFFGSHPFSRANELLEDLGGTPIDWALPDR